MKRPKLRSGTLIALVSLYFTLVLNYAFFAKVVELNPFTGTSADIFMYTMPHAGGDVLFAQRHLPNSRPAFCA